MKELQLKQHHFSTMAKMCWLGLLSVTTVCPSFLGLIKLSPVLSNQFVPLAKEYEMLRQILISNEFLRSIFFFLSPYKKKRINNSEQRFKKNSASKNSEFEKVESRHVSNAVITLWLQQTVICLQAGSTSPCVNFEKLCSCPYLFCCFDWSFPNINCPNSEASKAKRWYCLVQSRLLMSFN